jgi:hypothetical protein
VTLRQRAVIPRRRAAANPESKNTGLWNMDSGSSLRLPRNDAEQGAPS